LIVFIFTECLIHIINKAPEMNLLSFYCLKFSDFPWNCDCIVDAIALDDAIPNNVFIPPVRHVIILNWH